MKRETIVWIVGYGIAAIAVVILSYIGVAWYFRSFPPLLFGLEQYFKQMIAFPVIPTPTPLPPFPTIGPSPKVDASMFIRRQEAGESPVYVIRGYSIGPLTKTGENSTRGALYLPSDPKKTALSFYLQAKSGLYVVGFHEKGFGEFPETYRQHPFEFLLNRVPPSTFIQIRVPTARLGTQERAKVVNALESAVKGSINFKDLLFYTMSIELITP